MTMYGGMDTDERERSRPPSSPAPDVSPVRILLATDAAAEGIDLQNHCYRLIHYEIPVEPEPAGAAERAHRPPRPEGQGCPVYHFVGFQSLLSWNGCPGPSTCARRIYATFACYARGTQCHQFGDELETDLEFLFRVCVGGQIREMGKVGPVIAEQVGEAMLGDDGNLHREKAEAGTR